MPFGHAPAVFQTLVNYVLRDLINICVVVYLDDILIFSWTPKEHTNHVRLVLQRLLENRLFVKAEKCMFNAASVEFLGHILEKGQVRADPRKIPAVEEWAAPLTALTSTLHPFSWTPEAALSALKSLFTSAPVLILPQPSRQFIVEVDASEVGIGAILS